MPELGAGLDDPEAGDLQRQVLLVASSTSRSSAGSSKDFHHWLSVSGWVARRASPAPRHASGTLAVGLVKFGPTAQLTSVALSAAAATARRRARSQARSDERSLARALIIHPMMWTPPST